jgi:hypothetical protein
MTNPPADAIQKLDALADEIERYGLRAFVERRKSVPTLAGKRIVAALRSAAKTDRDGSDERIKNILRAIIVRCDEGDKKSDWLPIISSLAKDGLSILKSAPVKQEGK